MIMTQEFKINFRLFKTILLCLIFFSSCKDNKAQVENHAYTNDLIGETSPYLLQHAHNPVDWRPWSGSILDEAAAKDKLVIISIGYSSCHWCHVMEEETFEDPKVAEVMNKDFISVKVDREERPDVDQVYQDFCVALAPLMDGRRTLLLFPMESPYMAVLIIPMNNGDKY